jgi:predicted alpha/beta-fold hydrolase
MRRVTVHTSDGIDLAGIVLPASSASGSPLTFVLAHGFTGSVARPSLRRLAGWLTPFGEVRALDFRGHGGSGTPHSAFTAPTRW